MFQFLACGKLVLDYEQSIQVAAMTGRCWKIRNDQGWRTESERWLKVSPPPFQRDTLEPNGEGNEG